MLLVLEKIQEKKDVVYSLRIYSSLKETYTGSRCLGIGLTDTSAVNRSVVSAAANTYFLILYLDNFNSFAIIKLSVLRIAFEN